jgi:hypothetical protein
MTEETIIRTTIISQHNNFKIDNLLQSTSMYDSDECYISIEKFLCHLAGVLNSNVIIKLNGIENCYDNNTINTHIKPSDVLDCFLGEYGGMTAGVNTLTIFNVINNVGNWVKINKQSLANMNFQLLLDGQDIDFTFQLIFKIKYIKNKN